MSSQFFSPAVSKMVSNINIFRFCVKVRNSSRVITAADDRSPDVPILQVSSLKSNIHICALFPSTNGAPPDRLCNFCCYWNRLEDFMKTCDPHFDINCLDLVSEINFWSAVILRAPISLFYRLWYSLSLLLLFQWKAFYLSSHFSVLQSTVFLQIPLQLNRRGLVNLPLVLI